MSRNKGILLVLVSIVFLIIPFVPTRYYTVLREGTDAFETHHALYGKRVKSVSFIAQGAVRGVGLVFANLRHVPALSPVMVRVGAFAQEVRVNSEDDAFTWIRFNADIAKHGEAITIEVSAPMATQDNPVGVRFDKTDKQLAFGVIEIIPAWKQVVRWSMAHPELAQKVNTTVVWGVVLFVLLYVVDRASSTKRFPRTSLLPLVLLFFFTIAIRIPLSHSIDSAYGGDAFNYLLKSRAWIDGQDPFAADPRKAPLYSFLVLPGLANSFDAITFERWVSMLAAGGSAVLVVLFLRRFHLPYSFAIAGGALLAVNRDFQFESVQGLANTTFTFFVLLSGYLFVIGRSYALAVASGLSFLTRYEGAIGAAILLCATWFTPSISPLKRGRALIPLIILFAIPFVFFPITRSLGVRTVSDIKGDEGLYVAYSFNDFASNFIGFKHWFGRLWILTPHIGNPFLWLGIGVLVGIASRFINLRRLKTIIPYILMSFFLMVVIHGATEQSDYIVGLFAMLTGVGIGAGLMRYPKQLVPIVCMLVMHAIFITAILPKDRYFLPLLPYIAIACIAGIYTISRGRISLLLASFLVCFVYADAAQALPGQVSDYNEKSAGQTVLLNAARFVKYLNGVVAVADGRDLMLRAYLPGSRLIILPDSMRDTAEQLAMLREARVSFIVESVADPFFEKIILERPTDFEKIETFTSKWGDASARLYRLYLK